MMRCVAIILIFSVSISKYALCYQRDPWNSNILSIEGVEIPLFHFGEKSYYIGEPKLNYFEAGQFCNSINMELVAVHSANEFDALWNYVRYATTKRKFWTSGSILLNGHTWIWMSTLKLVRYTKWKPGEPNNRLTERCLEFLSDDNEEFLFNDRDCNAKASFICQRESYSQTFGQTDNSESTDAYPEDSTLPETIVDGVQYRVSQYKATQEEATKACKDYGLTLVNIRDKKKNDIVHDLISENINQDMENFFWASARKHIGGKWIWADSPDSQPLVYTNWADWEPDKLDLTKLCLYLFADSRWSDSECDAKFRFICEGSNVPRTHNSQLRRPSTINVYVHNDPNLRSPGENVNCPSGEAGIYYDIDQR